ncbi:MAG: tetratricopeptide repeat protein [Candidatus Brocadiia bacterium]
MVRFRCPCGRTYRLDDGTGERPARCPACGRLLPAPPHAAPGDECFPLSLSPDALARNGARVSGREVSPQGRREAHDYCRWGLALVCAGDYREACQRFTDALHLDPGCAEACYCTGVTLGLMGDFAAAAEALAEAARRGCECAHVYAAWAAALARLGSYEEAAQKCARALQLDPRHAEALCTWGLAEAWMGKFSGAVQKLRRASQLDPRLGPRVGHALRALIDQMGLSRRDLDVLAGSRPRQV